mgnify:CR=1 FL=1
MVDILIDNKKQFVEGLPCKIITFGTDATADYNYTDVTFDAFGCASYTLIKKGQNCGTVKLSVVGEHNILNSLSVIALTDLLGIDFAIVCDTLASFSGTVMLIWGKKLKKELVYSHASVTK